MIALAFAMQAMSPFESQRDPPEIVRMKQHLKLLEHIGSETIVKPLLQCIRTKADGTHPAKKMLGDLTAAARAADRWLHDCRSDETRAHLIAALRSYDESLDINGARTIAETGMSMTTFVTLMLANKTYEITGSEPVEEPVEIPRPQENHAQD